MPGARPALAAALALALGTAALPAQVARPISPAEQALEAGRTEEALRLAEEALKRNRDDAVALLVRSTVRCIEGEVERCRGDLDRALELDPTLRQGWLNRSALAIAAERYDEALEALERAERLDPGAPDNGLNQGAVLLLRGQLEPATAQFRRYLERNPGSAEALYLVATNFALSGYAALALQHLERAIALDERMRVRARLDPNFAELAAAPSFQRLMATDGYRPPPGSQALTKSYPVPWRGGETLLLVAVLNALQITGAPLDPRVEVAEDWALLWSDLRIKVARDGADRCRLELSAPPGRFAPETWQRETAELLSAIDLELLKLEPRGGR